MSNTNQNSPLFPVKVQPSNGSTGNTGSATDPCDFTYDVTDYTGRTSYGCNVPVEMSRSIGKKSPGNIGMGFTDDAGEFHLVWVDEIELVYTFA